MSQTKAYNGLSFLIWFLTHANERFEFIIPGSNHCTDQIYKDKIIYNLSLLNAAQIFPLLPCHEHSCWCCQPKELQGNILIFFPSVVESPCSNTDDTCFIWGDQGFSASIQVNYEQTKNSFTLVLVEVNCFLSQPILNNLTVSTHHPNNTLEKNFLNEDQNSIYIQSVMSKNLFTISKKNFEILSEVLTLLYTLWGPSDSMTTSELLRTTQQSLYKDARLARLLPRCEFISLTSPLIEWILQDGVNLNIFDAKSDSSDIESDDSQNVSDNSSTTKSFDNKPKCIDRIFFHHWYHSIQKAIELINGLVIPKVLWATPKDALWMSLTHSLQCSSAHQVILLLKSSYRVAEQFDSNQLVPMDIVKPINFIYLEDFLSANASLGLIETVSLQKSFQFRVFFYQARLVGISQKKIHICFPTLVALKKKYIIQPITDFFQHYILPLSLTRGAFDVAMEKKKGDSDEVFHCRLLNVSAWGIITDPLLFHYDELRELVFHAKPTAIYRIVKKNDIKRTDNFSSSGIPEDVKQFYSNKNVFPDPIS